jgi:hypothetical protein
MSAHKVLKYKFVTLSIIGFLFGILSGIIGSSYDGGTVWWLVFLFQLFFWMASEFLFSAREFINLDGISLDYLTIVLGFLLAYGFDMLYLKIKYIIKGTKVNQNRLKNNAS